MCVALMHINMGSHEVWLDGIGIMGGCLSSHERSVGYAEISGHQSREELTGFFFFFVLFFESSRVLDLIYMVTIRYDCSF